VHVFRLLGRLIAEALRISYAFFIDIDPFLEVARRRTPHASTKAAIRIFTTCPQSRLRVLVLSVGLTIQIRFYACNHYRLCVFLLFLGFIWFFQQSIVLLFCLQLHMRFTLMCVTRVCCCIHNGITFSFLCTGAFSSRPKRRKCCARHGFRDHDQLIQYLRHRFALMLGCSLRYLRFSMWWSIRARTCCGEVLHGGPSRMGPGAHSRLGEGALGSFGGTDWNPRVFLVASW